MLVLVKEDVMNLHTTDPNHTCDGILNINPTDHLIGP